jgi:hypothetical protein
MWRKSMQILSSNTDTKLQLELVQETSQQITFQRGKLSQSAAIAQGWRKAMPTILAAGIFCLLILNLMWQNGVFNNIPSNPIDVNLLNLTWVLAILGIPLAAAGYSLLGACFVTWTFDRTDRTIRREAVNLLKQKSVKIFRFDEIEKIFIKQVEDSEDNCIKCYKLQFKLRAGRDFTVSQGHYTSDRRERAISLKSHRELAEIMRNCLGHVTDNAERADRVYVPSAGEIATEEAHNWEIIKSVGSALFSSKQKRRSVIENIQEKLITDRENAQLWEILSYHLAMSKEGNHQSISALSRAEAIYRERGDIIKADELAEKISLFARKI